MKTQFTRRQFLGAASAALSLVVAGLLAYHTSLAAPRVNHRVNSPAPCKPDREVLICLRNLSIKLTSEPASFAIDISEFRQRLAGTVESSTEILVLELDDVEAERPPGAVWEVYVGLPANATPDTQSVYYVGNVALYGAGIRSEARQGFKPAHFAFRINRAVQAALKSGQDNRLQVTFVPHGVLVDGRPSRPAVQSPVRLGQATLSIDIK